MRDYYVYMMTNASRTSIYTGVTNDLARRVYEHKNGLVDGFTRRYRMHQLIYYEVTADVRSAIEREKQIKKWKQFKKAELVQSFNPSWRDLSEGLFGDLAPDPSLVGMTGERSG